MNDGTKNNLTTFKILLIGTSGMFAKILGVGKSSLLMKYVKNTFSYDYQVTTGV
ncbi:MAG: hypothetical protein E6Q33_01500 [Neisseriales bacterium]|nr:MAG: hypothetical protein E6Q33_01500 [Neisseriales bacterium]